MGVNEHERLSNITIRHKLDNKEQRFYCYYIFHSRSRVFNNENNSYPKMSMKLHLVFS